VSRGELGRVLKGRLKIAVAVGVHVKRAVNDVDIDSGAKVPVVRSIKRSVAVHVHLVDEVRLVIYQPKTVQDLEVGSINARVAFRRRVVDVHPVKEVQDTVVVDIDVEVVLLPRLGHVHRRV
jgi:hypothetical protein